MKNVIGLVLGVTVVLILSNRSERKPEPEQAPASAPREVVKQYFAAKTPELLDRGAQLISSGDKTAFTIMVARGDVKLLDPGTRITVEESGSGDQVRVRIWGSPDPMWTNRRCLK